MARWRREADLLLAERAELARRAGPVEVALPGAPVGVPAGRAAPRPAGAGPDAAPAAADRARPVRPPRHRVPRLAGAAVRRRPAARPGRAARRGRRRTPRRTRRWPSCRSAFLASEWADRAPVEVEVPFATSIAGVVVRGRMDAVFARAGRPVRRGRLEDRAPARRRRRAEAAAVQLAAYRLAWAELAGVPVDRVRRGVPLRPRRRDRPPGRPAGRRRAGRPDHRGAHGLADRGRVTFQVWPGETSERAARSAGRDRLGEKLSEFVAIPPRVTRISSRHRRPINSGSASGAMAA